MSRNDGHRPELSKAQKRKAMREAYLLRVARERARGEREQRKAA